MAQSSGKGGQLLLLLVLLGMLGGVGTWNYRRNVAAEDRVPRPYRGYSDADLDKLAAAYQMEIDALRKQVERHGGRTTARDRAFAGDQIREFERVQRVSGAARELGYRVTERETSLAALEQEKALRAGEGDATRVFLRRLFTYRP